MSFETIDINLVRGIVLIMLILAFAGIWAWAWSRKRTPAFREMSMLPLEEDFGHVPTIHGKSESKTEGTKE